MKENRMKSSQRKKEGEKEGQREGGETEKDTEQKEHKAGERKAQQKKKENKKTLKALKDRNISVEINSKTKMRGAIYWKGKGLFGIGQNGFEKSINTVETDKYKSLNYFHLR